MADSNLQKSQDTALPPKEAAPAEPSASEPEECAEISRRDKFSAWLTQANVVEPEGPEIEEEQASAHQHKWWQVMCLTGVDYYSTLGYLPAIAVAAAGAVAPI